MSEKGRFAGYLCISSLIITEVVLQAAFVSKRLIVKVGEHAFCLPYLAPSPPSPYFFQLLVLQSLKHDQLQLKYDPVMANTGFNLDQYRLHIKTM